MIEEVIQSRRLSVLTGPSLVTSPITSYADQIYSINKSKSIGNFSLDIPLIMLIASITKLVILISGVVFLFERGLELNHAQNILLVWSTL